MKSFFKTYIIISLILITPVIADAKNHNLISVRAERDLSLMDLIRSSGYELDDEKVISFLTEFINLNKDVKSIRLIPKGNIIKLPTGYLKKNKRPIDKIGIKRVRPSSSLKDDKDKISTMVTNIKKLLEQLGEIISIQSEGIIVFPAPKASLSIDTDYLPLIEPSDHRFILIDPRKRLPDELKDIIEVYWPEYNVISGTNFKDIINQVLNSIDYLCLDDGKLIIGDEMKVEIKPDCIIVNKGKEIMESDIIIFSIINKDEYGYPEMFLNWAKESGINIVNLLMKEPPMVHKDAKFFNLSEQKDKLIVDLLTILGYEVKRNLSLILNNGKDYRLAITADIAFRSGKKTKLIDLSGLPQPVINILRRHDIDIRSIDLSEANRKIILNILDHLSLNYETDLDTVSAMITPEKVKYRVKVPGIIVKSKRGNFLLSDSHNVELLKSIINSDLTIINYH